MNAWEQTCTNCDRRLVWHVAGQAWVHQDSGNWWCFPDRQGYDQPMAAPAQIDGEVRS